MKKIKYFFILSSIFLSFDTFSVEWFELTFPTLKNQIVMSDLEEAVVEYMREEHQAPLKEKQTIDKFELVTTTVEGYEKENTFSIDGISLTTQEPNTTNVKGILEDALEAYNKGKKGKRFATYYKILENSDRSKEWFKLSLLGIQFNATKEFCEKLFMKLNEYN